MEYPRIVKEPCEQFAVRPNLQDYPRMCAEFRWDKTAQELDWFDKEHINIAHVAVDSHLKTDRKNRKALVWESKKGESEEYTFYDLSRLSNRFANVLVEELGVRKGDRVFFFLERVPEIFIGILGALKAGAVIGPLFSAFGPDAVKDRVADSEAKVLEVVEEYLLQRNDIVINAAGIGEDVDERLLLKIVNNCRGNYTKVMDLKLLVEWYADLARDLKMITTFEQVPDFVPDDIPTESDEGSGENGQG